ncbi:MAG: hypothetical protein JWR16_1981 [Nevskia sp.]|nr:hypothetical protein [Nevskia sp.]
MDASSSEQLQQRAQAGDLDAMTALGTHLLLGAMAYDGAVMLSAAAERGSAAACERIAVLAGAGACTPQSWPTAFDFLVRAAKLGSSSARRQLALFCDDNKRVAQMFGEIPPEPDFWRNLRRSIDIDGWLQAPPARVLSQQPHIMAIDHLLPQSCCDWLIERARPRIGPARIYDSATGGARSASARSNSETDFNIAETDLVLLIARARIAATAALPPASFELTNVLHYAPGQRFDPHYDFLDPAMPSFAEDIARQGQRVATCLIYLNSGYSAGETEFPLAGIRYKGKPGDAVCFFNVDSAGQPDRQSLHAGLPPSSGEKWLLSQFIRRPVAIDRKALA